MFKEAYQTGVIRALHDFSKTAVPSPGRLARMFEFMGKHPEPFGAVGGAGVGAGTTALGGGDIDDILLGAGIGATAGGVGGMGLRTLRQGAGLRAIQDYMAKADLGLRKELTGHPEASEAGTKADWKRLKGDVAAEKV